VIVQQIQHYALILVSGLIPGVFWLWFFVRDRRYRPRPRKLLIFTFIAGGISVAPAAGLEIWLLGVEPQDSLRSFSTFATAMFFVVGPVEEFCKFAAVRFGVFRSTYFDEPLDGLIYATAASLGFASIENVIYAVQLGPEVMFVRGPLSTVAHVVFGSIWGLGLSRSVHGSRSKWLVPTLLLAALLHGLFNASLFYPPGILVAIALTGLGVYLLSRWLNEASDKSVYKLKRNVPIVSCKACGHDYRLGLRFCAYCEIRSEFGYSNIRCSNCQLNNQPSASYCASCGDYFVSTTS